MAKVVVFANLELAFHCPPGVDADAFVRSKERQLLRLLQRLNAEDDDPARSQARGDPSSSSGLARPQARAERSSGTLERLEFEGFTYATDLEGEPIGYYYNKHDRRAETR